MKCSGSTLSLRVPADYVLARDFCSYGYFLLAPSHWDPDTRSITRPFDLKQSGREHPALARITQPVPRDAAAASPVGCSIRIVASKPLCVDERAELKRQITRMLWLDGEGSHESIKRFHRIDSRWRRSGRGRLSRSPSLFEDIIKTVTSCNVAWPNTINMNELLCWNIGVGKKGSNAYPRASQLARTKPATLRARCRVGYRDVRIVELAKLYQRGEIDEAWLSDDANSDDEVKRFLVSLPGIGPYAAHNIMQLLGRFSDVPFDSETVRHAKTVLGFSGTPRSIEKQTRAHYSQFEDQAFRSYWFELLRFYESRKGKSWTWEPKTTGRTFTQAALKS